MGMCRHLLLCSGNTDDRLCFGLCSLENGELLRQIECATLFLRNRILRLWEG